MNTNILLQVYFEFDWVAFMNGGNKMVNIIFVCVFNAKIINNKSEDDVLLFVTKKDGCIGFDVSKFL